MQAVNLNKSYYYYYHGHHPIGEDVSECGSIEDDIPIDEVRSEPYTLPQGFVWDTLDISDGKVVGFTLYYWLLLYHLNHSKLEDMFPLLPQRTNRRKMLKERCMVFILVEPLILEL